MAEAAYAPVTETLAPVVGPTPEEIERRKLMAAALLKDAMGSEPIGHWTQGVSNIVQALMAGRMEKKAGEEDAAAEAAKWQAIMAGADAGIFGGGYGGGEVADVPGAEAVSSAPGADVMQHIEGGAPAGASAVYQGMLKRGLSPVQAAAWTASAQQESGFNPNANNPGEGARGHIQWRGSRLADLQKFAAARGRPWNDLDTQMDFGLWEMQNTESGPGQMFRAAQTPEEANRALKAYIRYGDKAGPAGSAGWDYRGRLNNTQRILDRMGGSAPAAAGETADIPGAEPVGFAPSPDVMAHIAGGGATPAGISIQPTPTIAGASPAAGAGTVPMPPVAAPVPPPAPAAPAPTSPPPPPLAARLPQPRPEPPVAPAAPATTGTVAAPAPARPVYAPPVKNDYNAMPGRPPAALPMRPGQLMQEPYSGPMSAQEFARQGQAAMRARAAGQQPTGLAYAPTPGGQPAQPRRSFLQALLGRSGPQGAAGAPAAPAASGAPAGGTAAPMDPRRAAMANLLANPRVDASIKLAALKNMSPKEREAFTLSPGQVRYGPDGRPVAAVPDKPEKREIREDVNGVPRYVDTQEPVFGGDTTGGKPPVKITDVAGTRKEIQDLPSYKNYQLAIPSLNSMVENFDKTSKASDLDYIYAMAKIFDPTSVVREAEQVAVKNTQGLPDQVVGMINAVNGGATLSPETRRALWETTRGRVKQYREQVDADLEDFRGIAGRWGINPDDILPSLLEIKELPDVVPPSRANNPPKIVE